MISHVEFSILLVAFFGHHVANGQQALSVVTANVSLDVDGGGNGIGPVVGPAFGSNLTTFGAIDDSSSAFSSFPSNGNYELLSPEKLPSSSGGGGGGSSSSIPSVYGSSVRPHRIPLQVLPPLLPPPVRPAAQPAIGYPAGVKYPAAATYVHPVYTRVKLGYGTFYYDGRQAELRCRFPYNLQVLSNFVWNKMSDNLYHYLDAYRVFEHNYGHTTTLYIRDVLSKDFGIYACAVTGSFYGGQAVTFYQEVLFFPPPPSNPMQSAVVPVVVGKKR